jgi:hypothetical protein
MKVVAIDPGPVESALVVWDSVAEKILWAMKKPNEEVKRELIRLYEAPSYEYFAIEMIQSFGMSVGAEVFETAYWIGRFTEAWNMGLRNHLTDDLRLECKPLTNRVYRSEVKMHLCHSMKAKDSNIRQALIDRLGKPGTKKNPGKTFGIAGDEWSSLAVAVTFGDTKGAK